jgi:putative ABC transport system permease protein
MNGFWQDVRFGFRMLMKQPGFTIVVVVAMGLGIGVTTMIYSVVHSVLMPSLPYPHHEQLLSIESRRPSGNDDEVLSYPDILELRQRSKTIEKVSAWFESMAYLTLGSEPERFNSAAITPGTLATLGIKPLIGREFVPEEGVPGKQYAAVIISHRLWKDRLHSDRGVLGRVFKINGRMRTVVGIMPEGIRFPELADFWIPLASDPKEDVRGARYLEVIARLRPGATLNDAKAELATISKTLEQEYPNDNKNIRFHPFSYFEDLVDDARPPMIMLMAAVVFVLLIACANVANLMLARAIARQRELSLRSALGAGRGRIARQLFTESVLIAAFGGVLGVVIAYWSMDLCLSTIPIEFPYWMRFGIDGHALAFTAAIAVGSGLVFGLAPVLHIARVPIYETLKEAGAQMSSGRGHHRMRNALVIAEIALSLVLLAGAGLMIRSFLSMQNQSAGIETDHVLTGRVTLPVAVYADDASKRVFFQEMLPRIAALPGVTAASATANIPLGNNSWSRTVILPEKEQASSLEWPVVLYAPVVPGYFETMGIPLLAGRDFTSADAESARFVAIVNRSAARQLWPGKDPLGQRLRYESDTLRWRTVVGVVGDVRQAASDRDRVAQIYLPHAQEPVQTLSLVIRTRGNPAALATPVRRLIQSRDPDLPFYEARTMNESIRYAIWEPRLYAQLMGSFAFIALVIAVVGIYGVMAYNVAQRTQEIGIRMAMGAARGTVLRMVIGQGMRLTAIGLGIGLAVAFGVTRLLASQLFGVSASDPPTFLGVIVILAGSALLACWLPALRATRVDPMVALRTE